MPPQVLTKNQHIQKLANSSLFRRIARGMFWSLAGTTIQRSLILVAMIVVARMIGKEAYGELGVIQSTVAMFGLYASLNLGLANTKYVAEFYKKDPDRAGRVIRMSLVVALLAGAAIAIGILVLAPWIAGSTLNSPELAPALRVSSVLLIFTVINGVQLGALAGFEAFDAIAKANVVIGILSFPIILICTHFGGLMGTLWALTINMGLSVVLFHFVQHAACKKHNVICSFKSCHKEWPMLWHFSMPAVLAGSMTGPVNWVCFAMFANQINGYSEIGIFNAANQWFFVILFIPNKLNNVIIPIMSNQIGNEKSSNNVLKTLFATISANMVVLIPLVGVLAIASSQIMGWYGSEFEGGTLTFLIILATVMVTAIQRPIGSLVVASGKMWASFGMNAAFALCFIGLSYLLLEQGAAGLAFARLGGYAIWSLVLTVWLLRNKASTGFTNHEQCAG